MATDGRVELASYFIPLKFLCDEDVLVRHRTTEFVCLLQ